MGHGFKMAHLGSLALGPGCPGADRIFLSQMNSCRLWASWSGRACQGSETVTWHCIPKAALSHHPQMAALPAIPPLRVGGLAQALVRLGSCDLSQQSLVARSVIDLVSIGYC